MKENNLINKTAYFHLPGLFEFYELYRLFLALFYEHREYFYNWCEIGSIYGAPADCLWGGGRTSFGAENPEEVLALLRRYGISGRLTFSNLLLQIFFLLLFRLNYINFLFYILPSFFSLFMNFSAVISVLIFYFIIFL